MEVNGPTKRATVGILALSIAMLFSLLIPTQTADASSGPCPNYSIQNVFDNPDGNWDGDQVNNSDELYNGLNPCIADTAAFCNAGGNPLCTYASYTYTYSDPYYYHSGYHHSGYRHVEYVLRDTVNNPCHNSTFNFPLADYDGDGVNNQSEVAAGTDPCLFNSRVVVAAPVLTIACPYYTADHVTAAPSYDWDGDGVTNLVEWRRGTNPCVYNATTSYRAPAQVRTTNRLPHVSVAPTPAPIVRQIRSVQPIAICPAGYPYYHAANGQCYANPIRNSFS